MSRIDSVLPTSILPSASRCVIAQRPRRHAGRPVRHLQASCSRLDWPSFPHCSQQGRDAHLARRRDRLRLSRRSSSASPLLQMKSMFRDMEVRGRQQPHGRVDRRVRPRFQQMIYSPRPVRSVLACRRRRRFLPPCLRRAFVLLDQTTRSGSSASATCRPHRRVLARGDRRRRKPGRREAVSPSRHRPELQRQDQQPCLRGRPKPRRARGAPPGIAPRRRPSSAAQTSDLHRSRAAIHDRVEGRTALPHGPFHSRTVLPVVRPASTRGALTAKRDSTRSSRISLSRCSSRTASTVPAFHTTRPSNPDAATPARHAERTPAAGPRSDLLGTATAGIPSPHVAARGARVWFATPTAAVTYVSSSLRPVPAEPRQPSVSVPSRVEDVLRSRDSRD